MSKVQNLFEHLGKYSLSAEIIAGYRDKRLREPGHGGNINNIPCAWNRALLSHPYTVTIQEWGLTFNPVLNNRNPKAPATTETAV